MKKLSYVFIIFALTLCGCAGTWWEKELKDDIDVFGHRNWIVVADSAYPRQSAPGIKTIYTGQGQIKVLQCVLEQIEKSPHIRPVIMLDSELDIVSEEDAPGVDQYRKRLKELLNGRQVDSMAHENIIQMLDEDSQMFNVLLLKTDLTIPYTSVFIKLDCGYWDAQREANLRSMISK